VEKLGEREGSWLMERIGRFMGDELHQYGINLNFAPVLDVDTNPRNPIIGDRAFSSDPRTVVRSALPFARGLMHSGVIPCGKHFPGHGDTGLDSHKALPYLGKNSSEMDRTELKPFREAIRQLPLLMTAHVVYPALDEKRPATLSHAILTQLLRKKLRFRGVVVSDDLRMKGITSHWTPLEAILLGIGAGVDLLLICVPIEENYHLIEEVGPIIDQDRFLKKRVVESLGRIVKLRYLLPVRNPTKSGS
jgi:beta-N-acetylhexosaminidase